MFTSSHASVYLERSKLCFVEWVLSRASIQLSRSQGFTDENHDRCNHCFRTHVLPSIILLPGILHARNTRIRSPQRCRPPAPIGHCRFALECPDRLHSAQGQQHPDNSRRVALVPCCQHGTTFDARRKLLLGLMFPALILNVVDADFQTNVSNVSSAKAPPPTHTFNSA